MKGSKTIMDWETERAMNAYQREVLTAMNRVKASEDLFLLEANTNRDTTSGLLLEPLIVLNVLYKYVSIQDIFKTVLKHLDGVRAINTIPKMRQRELNIKSIRKFAEEPGELIRKRIHLRSILRLLNDPYIIKHKEVRQDWIMLEILYRFMPDLYNCLATFDGELKKHLVIEKFECPPVTKDGKVIEYRPFILYVNTRKYKQYMEYLLLFNYRYEYLEIRELLAGDVDKLLGVVTSFKLTTGPDLSRSRELILELYKAKSIFKFKEY